MNDLETPRVVTSALLHAIDELGFVPTNSLLLFVPWTNGQSLTVRFDLPERQAMTEFGRKVADVMSTVERTSPFLAYVLSPLAGEESPAFASYLVALESELRLVNRTPTLVVWLGDSSWGLTSRARDGSLNLVRLRSYPVPGTYEARDATLKRLVAIAPAEHEVQRSFAAHLATETDEVASVHREAIADWVAADDPVGVSVAVALARLLLGGPDLRLLAREIGGIDRSTAQPDLIPLKRLVVLLRYLVAVTADDLAALNVRALTMLSWASWLRGASTEAAHYAEQALDRDREAGDADDARVLLAAVAHGDVPAWIAR